MKIVIDIPKENYEDIIKNGMAGSHLALLYKALANGTPLSKGHGRLIDADAIIFENADFDTYNDYSLAFDTLDYAPTIIEADKENEK